MLQVQRFPSDMAAFAVDRQEPRRCLVSGLFEEPVQVGETTRTFYTYLKPGLVYNRPCLVVAPPDDMPVLDYLEKSPWLAFAEAHDLFLHVLIPGKDGWDLTGADADYMNRVYVQINGRRSYVVMQDNIYAVGVGKGVGICSVVVAAFEGQNIGLGDLRFFGEFTIQKINRVVEVTIEQVIAKAQHENVLAFQGGLEIEV